jgi:hypothetical protein
MEGNEMSATFLDSAEIAQLTGRKIKSKQIDALRKTGLPFFVNATGHPVVARSAIESRTPAAAPAKKKWTSNASKAS